MEERELRFETRMADQEALMWALELDPVLRSTFANVTFFDRPIDPERFRARMERAVRLIPRLGQRVVDANAGFAAPSWVEDDLFDLDFHVRRVAVPSPGTDREVLALAALISVDPFDRARPLWQFTIVEDLEGGRGAMVQKMHHTITDGEGGVRMSTMFVDLERDAPLPLTPDSAVTPALPAEPSRSPLESLRDSVGAGMRGPLGVARRVVQEAATTIANPAGAPIRAGDAIESGRSVLRQLAVTEPARSPLWTERSLARRVEVLSVPLDDVKRSAKALGGTVNDLFVTGAVGAAGAYHRAKGVEVGDLRMAMPVSTRTAGDAGANAFAPTRMLVPAGIADPRARFGAVRALLQATKGERSVGLTARVAGVLSNLPGPVLARAARQQVGTVDFTTSNVRGAAVDLFIAGGRILANYPIGPMAGTAFNLTTLSSNGNLDMGCVVDTAAIDDPSLLRTSLVESYAELLALR